MTCIVVLCSALLYQMQGWDIGPYFGTISGTWNASSRTGSHGGGRVSWDVLQCLQFLLTWIQLSNHPVEHTGARRYANNSLQPQMIPKQHMRVPVMSQMSSQGIIPHFAHIPYYMYTPHAVISVLPTWSERKPRWLIQNPAWPLLSWARWAAGSDPMSGEALKKCQSHLAYLVSKGDTI